MLNVLYSCITQEHDLRLVGLAGFLCIFGCFTSANLFVHAREAHDRRRLALTAAAAAVFGASVWATHFVAELAFEPGLPLAYDSDLTALSLLIAVAMAALGMIVALQLERPLAGGFVIGSAIAAMHYTGMAALRIPADIQWNIGYVVLSLLIGAIGAAAAFWVLCGGTAWRFRVWATVLLLVAICGLHFVAMAAVVLIPDSLVAVPVNVVAPEVLAIVVAAVSIGIVALGMSVAILEEQSARYAIHTAEALRFSREHLARAQRISGVGSIVRDLRTGMNECSDGFRHILGIKDADFMPTIEDVFHFIHPDDRSLAEGAADASLEAGTAASPLEYRIVRPDGEVRVVYREMEVELDEAGQPARRIITFKDITELRGIQERERELHHQLMHAQKIEAIGTLAGGIAHDLNNTLVPILALAKLAGDELPDDSPIRDDIATIAAAGERARDLVHQILAFSRKQDETRHEIDIAPVVHQALQMLRATLPSTIRIVEAIEATPTIIGNAGQLHQVIVNLMTNAAQAIGTKKGTITLSVAANDDAIRLAVADNGCGMDKVTADRIFEPFFTTKGVGEGTGLGLSVVHGIVAAHGGEISVASAPGRGTTFTILLPAAASAAGRAEANAA